MAIRSLSELTASFEAGPGGFGFGHINDWYAIDLLQNSETVPNRNLRRLGEAQVSEMKSGKGKQRRGAYAGFFPEYYD
jgi:hypothetical protein